MFGHSSFSEAPFSSEPFRILEASCFMSAQSSATSFAKRVRLDNPTVASNLSMTCNANATYDESATFAMQTTASSDTIRIRTIFPEMGMDTNTSLSVKRIRLGASTATTDLALSSQILRTRNCTITSLSQSEIIGTLRYFWELEDITSESWNTLSITTENWTPVSTTNETWANNNPPPYGY